MATYWKLNCNTCTWFKTGDCEEMKKKICESYSPIAEVEDDYIDWVIEKNRYEYRREWFENMDDEMEG